MERVEEKDDQLYLGMSVSQFGVLVSLTSLSHQIENIAASEELKQLMSKFISEHQEKSVEDNLNWVRAQRDHLINILHSAVLSQSVIAQIDNALTKQLAAQKSTVDAVNNENSGE